MTREIVNMITLGLDFNRQRGNSLLAVKYGASGVHINLGALLQHHVVLQSQFTNEQIHIALSKSGTVHLNWSESSTKSWIIPFHIGLNR